MALIYETKNFTVESHEQPFVSRTDGGHLKIITKHDIAERTELNPTQATELMRLTMLVGEAMAIAMNKRGIPVVKINYEDLGNWAFKKAYQQAGAKPHLHIHLFGRAENAVKQPFPEAVYLPARESGFYDGFTPLDEEDIATIRKEIDRLSQTTKYQIENWSKALATNKK